MTKYTEADFANARFAEHPDGRLAHRINHPDGWSWALDGPNGNRYRVNENYMMHLGWVPVPTKPTITENEFKVALKDSFGNIYYYAAKKFTEQLGIEVIPDPEPTDEELLAGIIRNIDDWQSITSPELLAKYLNTAGVTPPNVKGN